MARLSASRPRVMIVTASLLIGGVEALILDTTGELMRRGKYAPVVCNLTGWENLHTEFDRLQVPVLSLNHEKEIGSFASTVWHLRKLINERQIAIVHAHQYAAGIYSRLASLGLNLPVIYHTHNTAYPMSLSRRWLDTWLTQVNTSVCLAVTQGMAESLAKTNPCAARKIQIFYNAVDPHRLAVPAGYDRKLFQSEIGIAETADWVVGAVGRLDKDKGYDLLLLSFANLLRRIPNAWLVIVGGGTLEAPLRTMASDLQVASRVIFTGYRNDIGKLMAAFDTFAISSETEAFPIVALEALACGIPIVMTDAVSARDVLKDYTVVVPRDPEKLSEAIYALYADPERAKTMTQEGCHFFIEHFSLSTYVDRLESLYDTLLSQRR